MNKNNFKLRHGEGGVAQGGSFTIDPDGIKGLVPVIISITPAQWPEVLISLR